MTDKRCIEHLPNEVLGHIFSFLPLNDLKRVSEICRAWSDLVWSRKKFLENLVLRVAFNRDDGVEYCAVLESSNRKYENILFHYHEDEDIVLKVLRKFQYSLKSVTIESDHNIVLEYTVRYLSEMFKCLTDLKELRIFTMISVINRSDSEQTIELPRLQNLETLYITWDSLEYSCFNWCKIAPNLKNFFVSHNSNNGNFVEQMNAYCQQLCSLGIATEYDRQYFDNLHNAMFPRVTKLTVVCWQEPPFEKFRAFFWRFTSLTELNIGFRMSTEMLSLVVSKFPSLTTVRLYNEIPVEAFHLLSKLTKLQHLVLRGCTTGADALSLANPFPSLRQLTMEDVDISKLKEFFQTLPGKAPALVNVEMAFFEDVETISLICQYLPNLQRLALNSESINLFEDAFNRLNQLEKLTEFRLWCGYSHNRTFTWNFFPRCLGIRRLYISVSEFADFTCATEETAEWDKLAENFPSLHVLDLTTYKNSGLNDRQFAHIRRMFPLCDIRVNSRASLFHPGTVDGSRQLEESLAA